MSSDELQQEATPAHAGLRPHEDARAIVRLFQCAQCSYPIRQPMTLPCGNSICRPCMPSPHIRANITYPQNSGRAEGFDCPFKDCGMEHSLADCSLDVVLNKVVEVLKGQITLYASAAAESPQQLTELLHWPSIKEVGIDIMPRSRVLHGGRIVSAFIMADMGELNYYSDLAFTPINAEFEEDVKALDVTVMDSLGEIIRGELECHVCYSLMVDPLTTACGHTFCRKCVARVLDHSNLCPACRRPLPMRPGVSTEPSNKRISHITDGLLADELAARIISVQEEEAMDDDGWMPLFPCTLSFPLMPTFLHIFEPRYRLMVRRCLENGTRKFGMIMYNARRIPQGNLGQSQYMQYGTALHISRIEIFEDGRSLLETRGLYRFRILEGSVLDGYHIGRIQRIDDMPLAEEEAIEALETSRPEPPEDDFEGRINHMSTQALLQYALDFIAQAKDRSEQWLHERVLQAYGQPPSDPATFPFWFASILPMHDEAKYQLLPTISVRERLKITARWIKILEEHRCASERRMNERVLRLARPLEPELEDSGAASDTESTSEPQAPETPEMDSADDNRIT